MDGCHEILLAEAGGVDGLFWPDMNDDVSRGVDVSRGGDAALKSGDSPDIG